MIHRDREGQTEGKWGGRTDGIEDESLLGNW